MSQIPIVHIGTFIVDSDEGEITCVRGELRSNKCLSHNSHHQCIFDSGLAHAPTSGCNNHMCANRVWVTRAMYAEMKLMGDI